MKLQSAVQLSLAFAGLVMSMTASAAAAAPAAGSGYLEAQQREYTPQGCTQNGNTATCTFTVVNRGNPLTLRAWPGDLRTLQLVDGSHVPHAANRGYFVDSSGNHQNQLVLQSGDQGSIVVEFPNASVSGTSAEFHLHSQVIGGAAGSAQASGGSATNSSAAANKSSAASAATPAGTGGTTTPAHTTAAASKAAAAPASAPSAGCASNAKSAACKAATQEARVCAKNPNSAACKQATARAQKLEAAGN